MAADIVAAVVQDVDHAPVGAHGQELCVSGHTTRRVIGQNVGEIIL